MAYPDKTLTNPITKQTLRFLQTASVTGGQLLEMESAYPAHSTEPRPHYHPFQEEVFNVLAGELTVRMNNKLIILKEGDTIHIPKNKVHSMWNNSNEITRVNWKVRPAMNTETFFETIYGLAIDHKTDKNGVPGILQVALLSNEYSDVFRLASPPFVIQKIVFYLLTPFAYLFGYRPSYNKYIN